MSEGLGLWLRRTRETRELSLDDVETALRIRRRYIQALEVGDYTALPGRIQTRGFLRNYARFLGLPVDEVLARYEADVDGRPFQPSTSSTLDKSQARFQERPSVFAAPPSDASAPQESSPAPIPPWALQIGIGILALAVLVFLGGLVALLIVENSGGSRSNPTPDASPVTATAVITETESSGVPVFVPRQDGLVEIRLEPQESAWVSVSADATVIFQGVADPAQPIQTTAQELVIINTGNGAAFRLYVNSADWGLLGDVGEIVQRSWTPSGEVLSGGP